MTALVAQSTSSTSAPEVVVPVPKEEKNTVNAGVEEAIPMNQVGGPKILLAPPSSYENNYKGVVKVDCTSLNYDYTKPWMAGQYERGTGTAFLIGPNLFLTNAHVVSNAQRIYLSQYGDSRQLKAELLHIAHDCDLALLKVEDFSSFEGVKPFKIGKLPRLEDSVRAIGYPVGGERLSVTRGVVSRIDTRPYSHSIIDNHLIVQIDAAINPGNSGGPVLLGEEVVGVAFQGLSGVDNTGYIIPPPVINHFLEDIKDGHYDNYVSLGISEFPILNPAMRSALGLKNDEIGVLVGDVYQTGAAAGLLEVGDVIVALDKHPVDSSGMITLEGETLSMNELAERKFAGESLQVDFIRAKEPKSLNITLKPILPRRILATQYDVKPRYCVFSGLVFQPANRNSVVSNKMSGPEINKEIEEFVVRTPLEKEQEIILLTSLLPDESNEWFNDQSQGMVESVNEVKVKNLTHLHELLHPAQKPDFFVIKLKNNERPLVIPSKNIEQTNARIAQEYGIAQEAYLEK